MKRVASSLIGLSLFLSLFGLISSTGPVEAIGTIHAQGGDSLGRQSVLVQREGYALLGPPPTEWNKTYGGSDVDETWSVVQTGDGGYALSGYTCSYTYGNTGLADFYLVKTDCSGDMLWNRTYGGVNDENAGSVIQTSDGGYALAGYSSSFSGSGDKFYLVKTNSSGSKQMGSIFGGRGQDFANSVVQTNDGGYVLAGLTGSFGAGGYDMYLVKTDSSGNKQWERTYGGIKDDGAWSMVQTGDGGFALAGWTVSFGAGNYDMYLVKIDSLGNIQWNKTYGGKSEDYAYSVVQTSDGGYTLAGSTLSFGAGSYDMYLVKTDSLGNVQWNRTYEEQGWEEAWSVTQTSDRGYALAGYTKIIGTSNRDAWLVRTDTIGQMQWNKTCGGVSEDEARCVIQTSDGGFAMAGWTCSFGAGTPDHSDAWLVKIAPEPPVNDVAVTNVVPSKTVVGQGYCLNVNIAVENHGDYVETSIDVTVYANATIIQTLTIPSLTPDEWVLLTFTWNTSGFAGGNYTICANAPQIPGETDTADNTYTYGTVMVTISGDVNGDFYVGAEDAIQIDLHWMQTAPPASSNVDINDDGIINIKDATIIGVNWLEHV